MSIGDSPYSIDQDWQNSTGDAAPTSGRVGLAPASPQGGKVALFKGTTGLLSMGNVDASGNQIVSMVAPSGAPSQIYSGQAVPTTNSQFGTLSMGRQTIGSNASYQPMLLDSVGNLLVANGAKPSFRVFATGITCASQKVLLSLFNAGTNYLRIASIHTYVNSPGTYTQTANNLLGLTGQTTVTNYTPVFCETYRISSHAKGASSTAYTPVACDSSDAPDANITCYSASTISSSLGLLHRRDALQCTNTGNEYYRVICGVTEKNIMCRPGEGLAIVCVSSGTINAAATGGTTTAVVDLQITFSQSAA